MSFPWKSKPLRPATVPTDMIIPLHYWDDLSFTRRLCIDITFRFDDIMDPEKIRMSLSRLLEIGDWKKLGARLRKNDAGKLEYHVPERYSEKRPGFICTNAKNNISINNSPLASRLPKVTDNNPSLIGSLSEFTHLIRHSDTPKRLDDWIYSDHPSLLLHIVLFNDATLMTITFLHTLVDGMGLASLFKAWTAVLHGREDEIPHFHGFNEDPLAALGETTPPDKYILSRRVLKGLAMWCFIFRFLFELFWYREVEYRVIFLPGRYLNRLRENALQELAAKNNRQEKPFISESDMVLAWWSRTVLTVLRPALYRTIFLTNVFDIRPTLADIIPSNCAFVANATSLAYTCLPACQILQEPLSFVASQLRRSLEQLRNREQVEASAAFGKQTIKRTGQLPIIGDSNSLLIVCSNWHRCRFFEIDFSPAVLVSGLPPIERSDKVGRPSYIDTTGHIHNLPPFRNSGIVMGKDLNGNWWLKWNTRKEAWANIEKGLRALSDIECS